MLPYEIMLGRKLLAQSKQDLVRRELIKGFPDNSLYCHDKSIIVMKMNSAFFNRIHISSWFNFLSERCYFKNSELVCLSVNIGKTVQIFRIEEKTLEHYFFSF